MAQLQVHDGHQHKFLTFRVVPISLCTSYNSSSSSPPQESMVKCTRDEHCYQDNLEFGELIFQKE